MFSKSEIDYFQQQFSFKEILIKEPDMIKFYDFLEEDILPIYSFRKQTNLYGEICSLIIILYSENFLNTKKALQLKIETTQNLYKFFSKFGEVEYIEDIKSRAGNSIFNLSDIDSFKIYNPMYIVNEDLFKLFKKEGITSPKIFIEKESKTSDSTELIFDIVRKQLYRIQRKKETNISISEIEDILYLTSRQTGIHLSSSDIKYFKENFYTFFKNSWFKTEKERKHYWYMKSKNFKKVSKEDINNRISKTVKTKKEKMLKKITLSLKLLNKKVVKNIGIVKLAKLIGISYNTLIKYIKEFNLFKFFNYIENYNNFKLKPLNILKTKSYTCYSLIKTT